MSLLDDWKMFCFKPDHFPAGYFSNLFREHRSSEEIEIIYAPFKGGANAAVRLQLFFEENIENGYWKPGEQNRASSNEILEFAVRLKLQAQSILDSHNFSDLAEEIQALPISFVGNCNSVLEHSRSDDILHVDYVDCISDIFRESYLVNIKLMAEIKEAAYQLTTNLDVTRHLISPLTSLPNSFDEAYRFWAKGGFYCFTNEQMEVSVID
jgi:hypothetical protein